MSADPDTSNLCDGLLYLTGSISQKPPRKASAARAMYPYKEDPRPLCSRPNAILLLLSGEQSIRLINSIPIPCRSWLCGEMRSDASEGFVLCTWNPRSYDIFRQMHEILRQSFYLRLVPKRYDLLLKLRPAYIRAEHKGIVEQLSAPHMTRDRLESC